MRKSTFPWLAVSVVCAVVVGAARTTEQAVGRPEAKVRPAASTVPGAKPPAPDAHFKRIFKRLDADGNGAVTQTEYVRRSRWSDKEKARRIWRASDANGDGKLTEQEYCENRRVTETAKEVFQWLDADRDGKLAEAEITASARRIFGEMDADASGAVTVPEFLSARWRWQVKLQWEKRHLEKTDAPDRRSPRHRSG